MKKRITKPCDVCGKDVTRVPSQFRKSVLCSKTCTSIFNSRRFTDMNVELNPSRMTFETRTKVRRSRLGTGEGKTYSKTYGRHTHRVMAEKLIGRPLRKGEVVHHIDENKRNNHPLNLMIFPNQAAHAAWHKNEQYNPSVNYE
jgi:uncharacterized protein (DUF1330 family)